MSITIQDIETLQNNIRSFRETISSQKAKAEVMSQRLDAIFKKYGVSTIEELTEKKSSADAQNAQMYADFASVYQQYQPIIQQLNMQGM
jgi:DNA gyrase/topoisomerase IV subunit A